MRNPGAGGSPFCRNARAVVPPRKASVHVRVDSNVLDWFRSQGKGYLTRMNAVLRSYMEAHRDSAKWFIKRI